VNIFDDILDNLSPNLKTPLMETSLKICSERLDLGMDYSYYLNEGVTEFKNVLNYAYKELVESIKELYNKFLKYLDALVLQDFTYLKHYIEYIEVIPLERFKDVKLYTHEYPDLYNYPKNLTPPNINDLIENPRYTSESFLNFVNKEYVGYVSAITGLKYVSRPKPQLIIESFGKKLQGREVVKSYEIEHLREALRTIEQYKEIKKSIKIERDEALEVLTYLGKEAMRFTDMSQESEAARAQAAVRLMTSAKESGRPLGKITYHDMTPEQELAIASKMFMASSFYKEMYDTVKVVYTVKVSKHKERYVGYKRFVQDILRTASVVSQLSKTIREAKKFKDIREYEMKADKVFSNKQKKKLKAITSSDPSTHLP
jgi:hypothetical protein